MSPPALVVSYTTVSPLPAEAGGLLSVARARGSPRVGVTHRPALWSPDFPRLFPEDQPRSSDRLASASVRVPRVPMTATSVSTAITAVVGAHTIRSLADGVATFSTTPTTL